VAEQGTLWTGVRNFQARNHLRAMRRGELVFYYHSGSVREIVGLARVESDPLADPTAKEGEWTAVRLAPIRPLPLPVSLASIKANPALAGIALVRQSRLSVVAITPAERAELLRMAGS